MTAAAEAFDDEPQTTNLNEIVTDADVVSIQNGLREAAAGECLNLGESSLYYDAATMASLNSLSAVSCFVLCFLLSFSLVIEQRFVI